MKIKDRIVELRRVKASELILNPKNWRTHPVSQSDALKGVLADVGFADAVIARETPDGLMLLDGHLRTEVATDTEIPVLIVDLNDEEADKVLATFDPLGAMAGQDQGQLKELLINVSSENDSVSRLLEGLLEGYESFVIPEAEPPEEEFDIDGELEKINEDDYVPTVKTGEIWQLGNHILLCGDCSSESDVSNLMGSEKANMLFTDPPYNVNLSSKNELLDLYDKARPDITPLKNDYIDPAEYTKFCEKFYLTSEQFLTETNSVYICGNYESLIPYYQLGKLKISNMIVWVKNTFVLGRMDYQNQHEFILYGWAGKHKWYSDRKQRSVWEFQKPAKSKLHPTMKPIGLVEKAINNSSQVDDLIYEPFAGSGTTIIASERLNRKCYAIEIDPSFCDVIIERWETYTNRKAEKVKNA